MASFPTRSSSLANRPTVTNRPPTSDSQRPSSVISSRMTDIASEDGDKYYPEGTAPSSPRRARAGGGGSALDPMRPGSAMSSQRSAWTSSPPSRGAGGWKFGGPGGTMSNTSRPQSATSRSSRTHVPITSHAFFRPMSSQRLQAQRGVRPSHTNQSIASEDGYNEAETRWSRTSLGSVQTLRQGPLIHQDNNVPPMSRGTDNSDLDLNNRATVTASPEGHGTVQSANESMRPLQGSVPAFRTPQIGAEQVQKLMPGGPPPAQKSPRSFRSTFLISKRTETPSGSSHGHKRLSSAISSPTSAQSQLSPQETQSEKLFNYQHFPGNTVFCWGGRLQNTRDRPINIATAFLVILPVILFFIFSAPWLSRNVSPAVPVFFAYIFYVCISSFVHASVTDPGILPRNHHRMPAPNSDDPLALAPPVTDWTMIKSAKSINAAMDVPIKYCKSCNIWRPPRAHHCRVCDSCIETQDHHCVWLNNCVGRRNYRYFMTFVGTGTLLGVYLTFASLGHLLRYQSNKDISFRQSISVWRVPFAMFIYGLLITPYPACLWGYHLFLVGRGETTREYLNSHKFLKADRHRPFTHGNFFKNWVVVLMRPRMPTYLHFKSQYEEGDQRFGPRRGKRQTPLIMDHQGGGMELQSVSKPELPDQRPNNSGKPNDKA